jgi:acyl carrier protein
MTATESKLMEVLAKGLKLQRAEALTPETGIFGKGGAAGSLGLDSVDALEIAVLVHKNFGVVLEEQNEELHAAFANIGALAAFIDRHRAS